MSLKSDTTALDETQRDETATATALDEPKWDWSKPKGMKPRPPPLPTWMIPKGPSMPILEEDRDLIIRECYKGVEDYIYQSPYDPTPLELVPKFFGGSPTVLLDITDDQYRSIVNKLSRLALEYYNKLMRTSFEFHDLVKCTYWSDNRRQAIFNDHYRRDPSRYCITFQAKEAAKGDTSSSSSSSPAITIFRAKVLVDRDDKDKPPVVGECFIHSPV
ncbi:uncharacterized protein LOC123888279 [Trifolium pratense]|uniref:uncharacterized protein LOC123888279 n=1 Tax=Trifolium pratense TaxID=57577 RepID=UPI001E69377C|nr:uncharacterized protein LOC123888279 [Trifolium pratense]